MKIDSLSKPAGPLPATETRIRPANQTKTNIGEKVELSPLASALQKAEAALAETPSVDRARVEEIKQAIRDGRFKIDASRIADGLIDEVKQMYGSKAGQI
ncbi:MAG: flagellar biosynthesis anti-sigma factor FlgM [Azoarcus sp.]|jgi:negative regulator of flagellin synthesis FlgM|nr:flagellar biosynthesis anti-sigma factor FlgM [Azoarcus sp.]